MTQPIDSVLNQGIALFRQNRLEEAVAALRQAERLGAANFTLFAVLSKALITMGHHEAAVPELYRALGYRSDQWEIRDTLARLLIALQRPQEALAVLEPMLQALPDNASVHGLAGTCCRLIGFHERAIQHYLIAVRRDPQRDALWAGLISLLRWAEFSQPNPAMEEVLVLGYQSPACCSRELESIALSLLEVDPFFSALLAPAPKGAARDPARFTKSLEDPAFLDHLNRPLWLHLLHQTVLSKESLEMLVRDLRQAFLYYETAHASTPTRPAGYLEVLAALAVVHFRIEYASWETEAEQERLEALLPQVISSAKTGGASASFLLALWACYRPLYREHWADMVLRQSWPPALEALVQIQLREPRQEEALKEAIPSLAPITHSMSQAVREQYEENPFPRQVQTVSVDSRHRFERLLPEWIPCVRPLPETPPGPFEVLIAGCGTGAPVFIFANIIKDVKCLAVDLSLASLAVAKRLCAENTIDNVTFLQGDILDLGQVGRQFDFVQCSGVLHHMQDPMEGWRVLRSLVRPGGYMAIALYSRLGRQRLEPARAYLRSAGYGSDIDGIRKFRHDVMMRRADDPIREVMRFKDFFSLSGCRDLMFPTQEHLFDLLQINQALDVLDLECLGLQIDDKPVLQRYRDMFPEDPHCCSLANWHQYEQTYPETFSKMYHLILKANKMGIKA